MLIAIDHGNKQMKTIHSRPFVSGLMESITRPFGSDILEYQGKFYTLSNQRIPYKRDRTTAFLSLPCSELRRNSI